ncbi:MAG: hypothetical protein ACOY3I_01295 [Verrucomicrobiota bacterium]
MVMKIVNPRGHILTAEKFKEKLHALITDALEAANVENLLPGAESRKAPLTHEQIRKEAEKRVKAIGLDLSTKEGKAAAGAVMLTQTIAAGVQQYAQRTGQPVSREAMLTLEKTLAQFAMPARGKVQDLKKIKFPWKP